MGSVTSYFQGKIAVVIGAGSKVGCRLAKNFAIHGSRLILVDQDEEALSRGIAAIKSIVPKYDIEEIDLSDATALEAMLRKTKNRFGHLDLVVNCQKIFDEGRCQPQDPLSHWQDAWGVPFRRYIDTMRASFLVMTQQESGQLLNAFETPGFKPIHQDVTVNAIRNGVLGMSLALRAKGRYQGIRVNLFCPFYGTSEADHHDKEPTTHGPHWLPDVVRAPLWESEMRQVMESIMYDRSLIIVPRVAWFLWQGYRFFPEIVDQARDLIQEGRGKYKLFTEPSGSAEVGR